MKTIRLSYGAKIQVFKAQGGQIVIDLKPEGEGPVFATRYKARLVAEAILAELDK